MPSESIDLVVTSPPYDNLRTYGGHSWDFEGVAQELWRLIKPGGVVVWVVGDATVDGSETGTSFRQALRFMEIGFRLHDTMLYMRDSPFPDDVRYKNCFEYCFVMSSGKPTRTNLLKDRPNVYAGKPLLGTVRKAGTENEMVSVHGIGKLIADEGQRYNAWYYWNSKTGEANKHPAPFPEALARDHILSWSNEGDIVLDPFSGSGTTAKMAKHNGRQYIGIEVNPEYVEISLKRLEQGVLF
jgi:site-specific DNA-methyltransferase (adenine-specific)